MIKLSRFIENNRLLGAKHAYTKIANPMAAAASPGARGLAKILPKSRLGRLGAVGALGAGALAMANKKEENFMDKATNYINGLDPSTVNTAMGLYSQLAAPSHMGYGADPTMGMDYTEAYPPDPYADSGEYLEDTEKTSHIKRANYRNYLKGALLGTGSAATLSGLAGGFKGAQGGALDALHNMGLPGLGIGGAIGLGGAGLLAASKRVKVPQAIAPTIRSMTPHEAKYINNYENAFGRGAANNGGYFAY